MLLYASTYLCKLMVFIKIGIMCLLYIDTKNMLATYFHITTIRNEVPYTVKFWLKKYMFAQSSDKKKNEVKKKDSMFICLICQNFRQREIFLTDRR